MIQKFKHNIKLGTWLSIVWRVSSATNNGRLSSSVLGWPFYTALENGHMWTYANKIDLSS